MEDALGLGVQARKKNRIAKKISFQRFFLVIGWLMAS